MNEDIGKLISNAMAKDADDNTATSTVISLIRQVIPKMIVNDIIGVQSMIQDDKKFPIIGEEYFAFDGYTKPSKAFYVTGRTTFFYPDETKKIIKWCNDRFGEAGKLHPKIGVRWTIKGSTYFFRQEKDRTLFLLTWGDKLG